MRTNLYDCSVPVFQRYLDQISHIVVKAGAVGLCARVGDSFTAEQHFSIAVGYALRVVMPLVGREVPDLPQNLDARIASVRAVLESLDPLAFEGAQDRVIRHVAGLGEVTQNGLAFLTLYGLPNFFFHLTMGYAAIRQSDNALGKADFDGFHDYPADFRF